MKRIPVSLLLILTLNFVQVFAQNDGMKKGLDAITESAVEAQLEFLSSDWMEGRETGTKGIFMAGDYAASLLKLYGVKPAGDTYVDYPSRAERAAGKVAVEITSYFQNFPMIETEPGDDQSLSVITNNESSSREIKFMYKADFSLYPSDNGVEVEGPVVFAGYGLVDKENGYNDYDDIETEGKFVLLLEGWPGHLDTASEANKKFEPKGRYASYYLRRNKVDWAKERGAIGVININTEEEVALDWASNYPFRYNADYYEGEERISPGVRKSLSLMLPESDDNINYIYATEKVASEILGKEFNFSEWELNAKNKMKPDSKEIADKIINLETEVNSSVVRTRNILGVIEGENPDEIIVVGAHLDHVGTSKGVIWNGADDNASGSVGVLTLAKAFAESGVKPKRTIIFALWTGEEKGLLGSEYFAEKFKDIGKVVLNLNYDMISRDDSDDSLGVNCTMSYTDTYPYFKEIVEKYNEQLDLNLNVEFEGSPRPRGGSDHSSFSAKDIPVIYFMAGFHDDYHRPADTADKANIEKMTKLIKLGYSAVWDIASRE